MFTSGDHTWIQPFPNWLPGGGNTEARHLVLMEEGGGGGGKVNRIVLAINDDFPYFLIQARFISSGVEAGQGGELVKHP